MAGERNRGSMFMWGGLALITGLPFLAAGVSAFLLSGRLNRGLPLTAVILFSVWFATGFHGAGVAAVCSVAAAVSAGSGFSLMKTIYWTAGLTLLAGGLLSLGFSGFMNIGESELEPLREVYLSAGMEPATIDHVFNLILYFSPGIGAAQITVGAVAAVLFFRSLQGRGNILPGLQGTKRFSMHWGVAWIPILCLAAVAMSRTASLPDPLVRMAGNLLLFMALPYTVEGFQVAVYWAKGIPGMLVLLAVSAVFATPLVIGGVLLTGILDTWFDYRNKIDQRIERTENEDSSDKDR